MHCGSGRDGMMHPRPLPCFVCTDSLNLWDHVWLFFFYHLTEAAVTISSRRLSLLPSFSPSASPRHPPFLTVSLFLYWDICCCIFKQDTQIYSRHRVAPGEWLTVSARLMQRKKIRHALINDFRPYRGSALFALPHSTMAARASAHQQDFNSRGTPVSIVTTQQTQTDTTFLRYVTSLLSGG